MISIADQRMRLRLHCRHRMPCVTSSFCEESDCWRTGTKLRMTTMRMKRLPRQRRSLRRSLSIRPFLLSSPCPLLSSHPTYSSTSRLVRSHCLSCKLPDPMDGSASLSEGKVQSFWDAGSTIFAYTAKRFVKSYPKGIRQVQGISTCTHCVQDSSNMNPMTSWLCGVQSVAMNMQTAGEELDLNTALFRSPISFSWNFQYQWQLRLCVEAGHSSERSGSA